VRSASDPCPRRWAVVTISNYSSFASDNTRAVHEALLELGLDRFVTSS
jgi:hypothetical protein